MFPASDRPYFKPPTLEFFFYQGRSREKISRIQHARVNLFLSAYLRRRVTNQLTGVFCQLRDKKIGHIVTSYSDTIGFTDGRTGSR